MSQCNDILMLTNPFDVGSKEYVFVEDFVINTGEIGPGMYNILLGRIAEVKYNDIKKWMLEGLTYYCWLRCTYWKIIATEVKRRNGYRCSLCNSGRSLQTHHSKRLERGTEHLLEGLECLCGRCHLKTHGKGDVILSKKQKQKVRVLREEEKEDFVFNQIPAEGKIEFFKLMEQCGMGRQELEDILFGLQVKCRVQVMSNQIWRY